MASRKPVIEIELPANESIDNYVVVEMDDKGDRREIEMGSVGGTVGEKVGIRADRIVRTHFCIASRRTPLSDDCRKGDKEGRVHPLLGWVG
jgi:hypothetical protein